jgi:hypothetical protein
MNNDENYIKFLESEINRYEKLSFILATLLIIESITVILNSL